jgi:hypothetical protein
MCDDLAHRAKIAAPPSGFRARGPVTDVTYFGCADIVS